jgi:hypothetical protein
MALSIIGSGFECNGSEPLKEALQILYFGPCHHMHKNLANP